MESVDVAVIGGGPAGYTAALTAADAGATVALIEPERPGGACVHHACIPTNIFLSAAMVHLEARELGLLGLFEVGEHFSMSRAAARKDTLVRTLAEGIRAALRQRKVQVLEARASFLNAHTLNLSTGSSLSSDAVIIATGTRWDPPDIQGVTPDRILTPDAVQALAAAPESAVVLADSISDSGFGIEYATLLALAGSSVALTSTATSLLSGLDGDVADFAKASFEASGIRVFEAATVRGDGPGSVIIDRAEGDVRVPAEVVVVGDPRRQFFENLNLPAAGVRSTQSIPVDQSCRTNISHIFAAGDVTGGSMLSSSAMQMGEVAGTNAAGGDMRMGSKQVPRLLHSVPELGWVGLTEKHAVDQGYDVAVGIFDMAHNARALTLGAREGVVKVIAERELGQVLGVHIAGSGASEVLLLATMALQNELLIDDIASLVAWHPSIAEGLVQAARRAR
jgi:dihydrolipoamide dehydrogenase